jgi:hypothetical protein
VKSKGISKFTYISRDKEEQLKGAQFADLMDSNFTRSVQLALGRYITEKYASSPRALI